MSFLAILALEKEYQEVTLLERAAGSLETDKTLQIQEKHSN
jgi:hypothetical protein